MLTHRLPRTQEFVSFPFTLEEDFYRKHSSHLSIAFPLFLSPETPHDDSLCFIHQWFHLTGTEVNALPASEHLHSSLSPAQHNQKVSDGQSEQARHDDTPTPSTSPGSATLSIPSCERQHHWLCSWTEALGMVINFKHTFTSHSQQLSTDTQIGILSLSPLCQYLVVNGINAIP